MIQLLKGQDYIVGHHDLSFLLTMCGGDKRGKPEWQMMLAGKTLVV